MIDPAALPESDAWGPHASGPIAFDAFAAEFLGLYRPPLRARATLGGMTHAVGVVAELLGPGATTAGLTPAFLARLIAARSEASSPNTVRSLLMKVKAMASYAHSRGYVRSNPFSFRRNWIRPAPAAPKKHHSSAEVRRVLDLAAAEVEAAEGWARWRARRLRAVVNLFAFTGLRRDEGLNLHVEDVDLGGGIISIVERSRRLKTTASAQPVPLAGPLAEALAGWLPYRLDRPEDGHAAPEPAACPWLIPNVTRTNRWKDGPMGHRPIDQLKALGERAGVPGLTFLSLRHSFATAAEGWGWGPTMIQRVLRHTSINTQKHYRHADLDNLRAAGRSIGFGPAAVAEEGGRP